MMERPALHAPKSGGRSRFSKALPAPPPKLEDDRQEIVPQTLPSVYSQFLPRKDSLSAKSISSPKLSLNLPLPTLPPEDITSGPKLQKQAMSIPRKPVGLPANPTPALAVDAQTKKMRRVSSISSLLSAYSNTSSDSVQRSSQGSVFTKDSEPSNSPEREGMNDTRPSLAKTLTALPSNPYGDEMGRTKDEVKATDLPPPPPLKDPLRTSTPSHSQLTESFPMPPATQYGVHDRDPPASPPDVAGNSPQQREIWRRRVSSKTDHGPLVPELRLADSHGSTASTASTAQPVHPDPLPPPQSTQNNNTTSPLPPRSTSLPGRNVRPDKQAEPQPDDRMRKLSAKLKGLTGRGDATKTSEKVKDKPIEKGEHFKELASSVQREDNETDTSHAHPIKDQLLAEEPSVPKVSVETVVFSPTRPGASSETPPKESVEKPIPRRAIGAPTFRNQPEVHKKGSSSDLRQPALGLPLYPRPSQSNPSLRSPSTLHNAQETMRPKASQPIPPVSMSLTLPSESDGPMKKPDLFNVVTALNEPTLSPNSSGRKPMRNISRDFDTSALSDIGESVEHMTPEQTAQINEALSRFPRNYSLATPPNDTVWRAAPISSRHYSCYVRHNKWISVNNSNYPLACQTCGVEDTGSRKTCSWCNLRICFGCHERLTGLYKSDLKLLMENIELDQRSGKEKQVANT
ncbi:uncharacterized protein F4812DRAFT_146883 [Daldinia caldariorum]|uniref:uncharacterized protein n=1 Tax=Daldinia caldariorum TaxID=326644 RepID=UPI002007A35F|nr:uncharacterized protein F4812DRAFT_146883 [Daldinia caldariorum]KAI1464967.1 hypothetical protein F4812DRAFT_146883 [Daldinia caldariorum]